MQAPLDTLRPPSDHPFLQDGDCGGRLRTMDWSRSPLGLPEHWCPSLKTAVGLLLPSSTQIALFWGPDLVALYNDAYSRVIGSNHPAALGQPARIGWASVWSSLEPLLRGVQRTGLPFDSQAMLFRQNRHGVDEDTYFDVSYSPVRSSGGIIEGIFCIVADQTRRIIDKRRLNTLRMLAMRPRIETADQAARSFTAGIAEQDPADAPYAVVYLRGRDGILAVAASQGGVPEPALLQLPSDVEPHQDPRLAALARVMRLGVIECISGHPFVIDPPPEADGRQVLLPLHAGSDVAGVLVIARSRHLQPATDYRSFCTLLAAQLSASLSTARVVADVRHRSRALEQQVAAALAEREIAEARLRQSQKMEAIGKLTGGVAHDFNNLLQVVGGNLHLLSRDVAGNPRAERRVANALAGVERGAKLSAHLLAFSRRQPLEPKVVRIGELIADLEDMLRRSLGEGIHIEVTAGAGLWNALIDPAQMENALLNLAINARDAMDGQGLLTIQAGNAVLDEVYARAHREVAPGSYVVVAVTDTGTGMTPEIMEQVFEPFFSTKPEGKGTGLGLSMVYGFVRQSGGHVGIDSEPGRGTTVRLYLPRTLQAEELVDEIDVGSAQGGSETILVAEDNDGVRDTVVSMLADLGYHVLKARDAASALTMLESGIRVDLLFTDVVMPGPMRGPELARAVRKRIPDIAVLFTSGYTDESLAQGGWLDVGAGLLAKPYTSDALARKLRQVLSMRSARARARAGTTSASAGVGASPPRPLRLLLVEDDAMIRDRSSALLTMHGHAVVQPGDAQAALGALALQDFDVLITDVGLPGVNGIELARRALHRHPGLGVVFATGADTDGAATGALKHAVLLPKPYDEAALLAAVATAARTRS